MTSTASRPAGNPAYLPTDEQLARRAAEYTDRFYAHAESCEPCTASIPGRDPKLACNDGWNLLLMSAIAQRDRRRLPWLIANAHLTPGQQVLF